MDAVIRIRVQIIAAILYRPAHYRDCRLFTFRQLSQQSIPVVGNEARGARNADIAYAIGSFAPELMASSP